ncbi:hypothetical protein TTHERM_00142260 (macronuclear) [Tetrahymena thermophila SB210]|uniref:Uncharacterized protein n=1 Tax=Tetrahymena thermophila (strain SB210) TaxID=312017 RepID=I7M797_TETTS|nr:hypothetical protein TTHERM_00142260 [Tetrahymena thermophila SB210]EAR90819.2 hypothetical protein TTHERM_00142260 [Tetrahymena thermophila SB210]|eukprot:XP_001011064.2 hypothetical protein TTHERM_00142260 [Tetrahymena thermophila SB210]
MKQIIQSTSLMFCISENEKTVFIATGSNGIQIIDVSEMANPSIKSNIQTKQAQHCQVKNNTLFIADQQEGLIIADVRNLNNPYRLSTTSIQAGTAQSYQYVLITQDIQFAFILSNGNLLTYFLNDLSNPKSVSVSQGSTSLSTYSYKMRFDQAQSYIILSCYDQGLLIFDVRNVISQQLRTVVNPNQFIVDCVFTQNSQGIYALDINSGLYYADITQLKSIDQNQSTKANLSFSKVNLILQTQFLTIQLTNDGNYLLVGLRSTIRNAKYMIMDIIVSPKNSQYVFIVNGVSLLIFQTDLPNLNQDFPNFFNQFQSSLQHSLEQNVLGMSCLANNLIVSYPKTYVTIYDISTDPYSPKVVSQIQKVQNPQNPSDLSQNFDDLNYIEVSSDGNTLYLSSSKSGLITFSIQDKAKPIMKNKYIYQQTSDNGGSTISLTQFTATKLSSQQDQIIASNSVYGAVIFKISNSDQLSLEQYRIFQNKFGCTVQRCDFTSDGQNLACPCKEVGTLLFDLKEQSQYIQPKQVIYQIGVEQAKISDDDKLLFLANGFQGLIILDIKNFFNPIQLSEIILEGWTYTVYPIFNNKYIITTQVDEGQITLINIQDPKNPYIQQKINFPGETSTNVCINPNNQKHMYFVGNMGLRYFPIQSDLNIHSQFQVAQNIGTNLFYQTVDPTQKLLVGQQVRITFQQLYAINTIKINSVKYQTNFKKQSLPSWISFNQKDNQVNIQVNQSGINQNGENFIILEILKQIQSSDFILNGIIDSQFAQYLYMLLQINNIIDQNGYLNESFNSQLPFQINFYNSVYTEDLYKNYFTQIQNLIKKTLVFSRIDYPVRFFVASSLVFNFDLKIQNFRFNDSTQASQNFVIQSLSDKINIQLSLLQNAQFQKIKFDSVLSSYSEDLRTLNITGPTQNINNFLINYLQIRNLTQNISEIMISIQIQDYLNKDQAYNLNLNQTKFIQLYQPISRNLSKSLQSQFDFLYPSSSVYIQESFTFSFNQNTFLFNNQSQIQYQVLMGQDDSSMKEISNYDWIQFNPLSLTIYGQASNNQFLQDYTIKVITFDQYTKAEDQIVIKFNKVPFIYVFEIAFKIFLPILFILIVWSYKMQIHFFILEKNNIYQTETAIIGKHFEKKIILYGSVQADAIKLWELYKKRNKDIEQKIQNDYKQNKLVDIYAILKQIEVIYQQLKQEFPKLDPREFDFDDSRLVRSIKRQIYEILLLQNPSTFQVYKLLKDHAIQTTKRRKDWYKLYLQINNSNQKQKESQNQVKKNLKQIYESEKEQQSFPKVNLFDQMSFQQLRLREVYSNRKIQIPQNKDKLDLFSTTQLNNSVQGQSPQSPTKKYEQKQSLYKYFKDQQSFEKVQQSSQETNHLSPFPEIMIYQSEVSKILKSLKCTLKYDFNLLAEYLALEASGTLNSIPNHLNPSAGESLHLHSYNLSVLKAFKKDQNQSLAHKIKNYFNLSYFSIGLSQNNPLPKWLNYRIIDGVIYLFGFPEACEESEILIRIFNKTGFSVYSFHINIKDQNGNDLINQLNLKQTTTINLNSKKVKIQKAIHSSVVVIQQQEEEDNNKKEIIQKNNDQKTQIDNLQKAPSFQFIDEAKLKLESPTNVITLQQTQQNAENTNMLFQTEQSKQNGACRSASLFEEIQNDKSAIDLESNNNQTFYQNHLQESFLINEINQSKQQVSQFLKIILYNKYFQYSKRLIKQLKPKNLKRNLRSEKQNTCLYLKFINIYYLQYQITQLLFI